MAKAKKAQKTVDSWKRKHWHKILASKLFNEQPLGETPALEPDMVMGRTVSASLMMLTRDMKKQGTYVTFEVERIQGDTAFTHIKEIEIMPSSIRRLVRRHRDRIEDSFVCTTSDGINVRIKPFFLTRNCANNSIGTAVRKLAKTEIVRNVSKMTYETLVKEVLTNRIQSYLRSKISKIYPLRNCEIRKLTLLGGQELPRETGVTTSPALEEEQPRREAVAEEQ